MIKINDIEILTVLDGMTWSGAKDQGPRSLQFQFLYKPINKDVPVYSVSVGDPVIWEENGKILFQGYVEVLNYNTDNDTISVDCKDLMSRLMRSKFIGRMTGTLNQIANKICGLFNLQNGINVNNTHVHNIVSNGEKTYYNVLHTACGSMFKRFNLYLDGKTLKLSEHTVQNTFKIGINIRSSSFKYDMTNIVTKVLIIDNDGNLLKPIPNNALIAKYGLFQETYNYNKDIKNNIAEAEKLIKGPEKEAVIICDNDNNCIAGRFIKVLEPVNNYMGFFEILDDNHVISADSSMTLKIVLVEETEDTEGIEQL